MATDIALRWVASCPASAWTDQTVSATTGGQASLRLSGARHQRIEGFGGCFNELGWRALSALDEPARDAVLRELFDPVAGCRFAVCRVPIGANDFATSWYSHNETDGDYAMDAFSIERDRSALLPYIGAALAHRPDLTLFASPWSPPTWMKHPCAYNYGTLRWEGRVLDAYALYLARFVEAYKAEGVRIHQVHVQNEPTADQKFPSCVWTGAQLRDFIRDYLGPTFHDRAVEAEIWLGTINSASYDDYAHLVLSDAGARAYIAGVGYQWAGKEAIQRTYESWPALRLMQTESECGDGANSWAYAHYTFGLLRHYVSNGAASYVYWNMALAPGGMGTWGWRQNSLFTVDPQTREVRRTPEFYVMKHVAHFVSPGAVRLGLTGPWAANAIAAENPDGQTVVVVNNPFDEPRPLTVGDERCAASVTLAARSINTLVLNPAT